MVISLKQAVELINSIPNGQIFTVEFIKRTTGELRRMNCRKGVRKGVNGEGRKFDPASRGLIGVYDMQIAARVAMLQDAGMPVKDDGHRFISVEGIRSLACNGQRFEVVAQPAAVAV
jgi:hypothetical protein